MPNLDQIKAQIKTLDGFETFLGKKEINELPNILWEDENVENIIQGTYNNGNGILVATNKRLVFVDKGIVFGLKVEDFPYNNISSIQYETGFVFGKLTIFTSGNKAIIDNVIKGKVRTFGEWVRAKISSSKANTHINTNQKSNDTVNVIEQLERLANLKSQGILTEQEFDLQKKKILGQ